MNRFVMKEPIVNEVRHGFRETTVAGNHNVAVGQLDLRAKVSLLIRQEEVFMLRI